MANTYVKIATVTVGSGGSAAMSFSSIPSTYTDLVVKLSTRVDQAVVDSYFNMRLNADSGANYSTRSVYIGASSSAANSDSWSAQTNAYIYQGNGANATASTFANIEVYLPNYASSNAKSFSNDGAPETNSATWTSRGASLVAGLWSGTAAINAISFTPASGNFVQYSTATLYGISKS